VLGREGEREGGREGGRERARDRERENKRERKKMACGSVLMLDIEALSCIVTMKPVCLGMLCMVRVCKFDRATPAATGTHVH
jgi:hypothetical protein